jgi:hypothetical protein
MNKLDLDYQSLLQDILDSGMEKSDRNWIKKLDSRYL